MPRGIAAIVWDFDGTLADTAEKNRMVTRQVMLKLGLWSDRVAAALADREVYEAALQRSTNWQTFYAEHLGLGPDEVAAAGAAWALGQRDLEVPCPLMPGVTDTLTALSHLPHGIVSQNAREQIECSLRAYGIDTYFGCIIGYRDVPQDKQKPDPEGLIRCADILLGSRGGVVLYVGDHPSDVAVGRRAAQALSQLGRDIDVETVWLRTGQTGGGMAPDDLGANYIVSHLSELRSIVTDRPHASVSRHERKPHTERDEHGAQDSLG